MMICVCVMSYSMESRWDQFSRGSVTKVREYLCVLRGVLVVNLHINIQNTRIKGGYQTWSYIKFISITCSFTCVITLQLVTEVHTSRETGHKQLNTPLKSEYSLETAHHQTSV